MEIVSSNMNMTNTHKDVDELLHHCEVRVELDLAGAVEDDVVVVDLCRFYMWNVIKLGKTTVARLYNYFLVKVINPRFLTRVQRLFQPRDVLEQELEAEDEAAVRAELELFVLHYVVNLRDVNSVALSFS